MKEIFDETHMKTLKMCNHKDSDSDSDLEKMKTIAWKMSV